MYAELKRVQQYFGKIKKIEEPETPRNMTLNQEAAARILRSDLVSSSSTRHRTSRNSVANLPVGGIKSDNRDISSRLAEKIAEERAKALLKSVEGRKRPADDSAVSSADDQKGMKKTKHNHKHKGKGKGKK